jgi:hypothetical protein
MLFKMAEIGQVCWRSKGCSWTAFSFPVFGGDARFSGGQNDSQMHIAPILRRAGGSAYEGSDPIVPARLRALRSRRR